MWINMVLRYYSKPNKISARFSVCLHLELKTACPFCTAPSLTWSRGYPLGGGLLRQNHSQHDQSEAEVGLCLGVLLKVDRDDNRLNGGQQKIIHH